MRVLKRSGALEDVSFDKVLKRITVLSVGLSIDPSILAQQVCGRIYDKIPTSELDEFASSLSASMSLENLDYEVLASRIIISNIHKNTFADYVHVVAGMKDFLDPEYVAFVNRNESAINQMFRYERDYLFDYFGFKTLEKGKYIYRNHSENKPVERPQHMWMRVAIGIHAKQFQDSTVLASIKETYDLLSLKKYTHATPTLFNAGTKRPQLSSCFLLNMQSDSIEGIYDTLKDCALISKEAGGIGLSVHKVRAKNSAIRGTNGFSNGLVPMLKVFNETAKYVDQCLLSDTLVYTEDGPLEIQYCTANETKLYNISGSVETIANVLEFVYSGDIYQVFSGLCDEPLKVTAEHPLYVLKGGPSTGFPDEDMEYANISKRTRVAPPGESFDSLSFDLEKRIEMGTLAFQYVEAKELAAGDYLVYRAPNYSQDYSNLSLEDCYIYGCLLSAGDIDQGTPDYSLFQGYIDAWNDDLSMHTAIRQYFDSKCILYVACDYEDQKTRFAWHRSTILPFKHGDLYKSPGVRHLHKKWLNLPKKKCKQILRGILHGCGSSFTFMTSAPGLLEAIQFLCLKVLVVARFEKCESPPGLEGLGVRKCLRFVLDERTRKIAGKFSAGNAEHPASPMAIIYKKNFILVPISKICRTSYRGVVYDLQMTNHHNYLTAAGGVVHNGGGKRKGSFSIYLEPWHADIQDFLELKKSRGSDELRARDLFFSLWIPDLFMKRVREEKMWTLFCPNQCPGLSESWGKDFELLYTNYEARYPESKRIPAQELWRQILTSCVETGGPSILFKDHCNRKSNHQHLGAIQSSNLCTEIIQFSSPDETAVCNLASICLPNFVEGRTFDYQQLRLVVRKIVENLNRVIDVNYYPTEKCLRSNRRHRPMGIGVQGMADMFHMMELAWEDPLALQVNRNIFEVIYYSALEKSCELAQLHGKYETFDGSPLSQGILQFHYWDAKPTGVDGVCQWDSLTRLIAVHGCRNSLLVAPMPTASTSQIMGFSECFEPYTSNIFVRRTSAGEFKMLNKFLITKLIEIGLWNREVKNKIIMFDGSVQWMDDTMHLEVKRIKMLYKTVWELKHKLMIDFAVERGAFIDQSQSFNVYMEDPSINKLNSAYFYSWQKGLTTCQYYLRIRTKAKAIQFTVDHSVVLQRSPTEQNDEDQVCNRTDKSCTSCSA